MEINSLSSSEVSKMMHDAIAQGQSAKARRLYNEWWKNHTWTSTMNKEDKKYGDHDSVDEWLKAFDEKWGLTKHKCNKL